MLALPVKSLYVEIPNSWTHCMYPCIPKKQQQQLQAAENIICHREFETCLYLSVAATYGSDVSDCLRTKTAAKHNLCRRHPQIQ